MENLFDFLEKQNQENTINLENKSNTRKSRYTIDEKHLEHLEKVKTSLYNEDE